MRFGTIRTMALAASLCAGAMVGVGCSTQTESQKTQAKADRMDDAAAMIREGEGKVASGKATIARAQAMKDAGDVEKSHSLMAEGEATKKAGEALIEQGKALRDKP